MNQTTTITLTGSTHTVTTQAPPFLLFGVPPELAAVFTIAIVAVVYLFFRFQVKGVPVIIELIARNYQAKQFRAQQDLNGLWLYILNARGKKAATLKKTGLPVEVHLVDNKSRAYMIQEGKRNGGLDPDIKKQLYEKGWKIREIEGKKEKERKAYIFEEPSPPYKTLAYIDIEAGGQKRFTKFTAVEGTGTTMQLIDVKKKVDEAGESEDDNSEASSGLIHEELAAAKSFLVILAEAMQGAFKSFILPMIAGAGLSATAILLVLELTGHLH